jgi:hypothetical protein
VIDMVVQPTAPAAQPATDAEPPVVPGRTVDDQPVADLSRAPLPSASTLRRRRSVVVQSVRFVAFNGRIMRMVIRGHRASH